MSDFRKRFFLAPRKEPCKQKYYEEQNQLQKVTHPLTPTQEEKLRQQKKSVLHQEVSEFKSYWLDELMQLIKVLLNLQEEDRKLRIENSKLSEQIQHEFQETLSSEWLIRRVSSINYGNTSKNNQLDEFQGQNILNQKQIDLKIPTEIQKFPKLKKLAKSAKFKRTHYGN